MLYYIRFVLICKNHKGKVCDLPSFNDFNRKEDVHPLFYQVNAEIPFLRTADEFEKATAIATYLRDHIKGGRGLGLSSNKTLELMLDGKGGVCSDFSQIFNVFCLVNDIKIREWGSVEKFYNPHLGHTFNEIYSSTLKKWVLLDTRKNIYFKASDDAIPMSVVELFTYLKEGNLLKPYYFSDYVCKNMHRIGKTYSKDTIAFVISNYDNKVYDKFLNKFQDRFPSFFINALLILLRKNYNFIFVFDNYKAKLLPSFKKTAG